MTIKATAYQRGKVSVESDAQRLFICPAHYWLHTAGDFERELTADEYEVFLETVVMPYCTERAVNLLRYRDHSTSELEKKLRRLMSPELAARVVRNLAEKNYLDDAAYAGHTAERLSSGKMMSKQGVYRALIAKGIDRETAGQTIETLENDEPSVLDELAAHALRGKVTDEKLLRRLYGKMLRLGYSPAASAAAIQRAKANNSDINEDIFGGTDE